MDPIRRIPRGVFFDIDGTLLLGDQALPDAVWALEALRAKGLALAFLTNNSAESSSQIRQKLVELGLAKVFEVVISGVDLAVDFIRQTKKRPFILGSETLKREIESTLPEGGRQGGVEVVIVGFSPNFWDLANEALRLLLQGSTLVAVHKDRLLLSADNAYAMNLGCYVAMLEYGSKQTAVILGKPEKRLLDLALSATRLTAQDILYVGDDPEVDVPFAENAGIECILRRSLSLGKHRIAGSIRTIDSLEELVKLVKQEGFLRRA